MIAKPIFLTVVICAFFVWAYICARIIVDQVDLGSEFWDGYGISFAQLGIMAFALFAICLFGYLALKG